MASDHVMDDRWWSPPPKKCLACLSRPCGARGSKYCSSIQQSQPGDPQDKWLRGFKEKRSRSSTIFVQSRRLIGFAIVEMNRCESIWVVGSIRFSIIVVSWSDRTVKNLNLDLLGKHSGARLVDFTMLPRQSTSLESITRVWKRKELACQNQEIVLYTWRNQLTAHFGFSGLCIPYGDFPISNNAELSSVGGCTTKWRRRESVKIDMTPKLHRWKPNDSKTVIELIETVILPVRQDRYRCLLLYVSKRLQSPPVTNSTWRAAGRCIF